MSQMHSLQSHYYAYQVQLEVIDTVHLVCDVYKQRENFIHL